MAFKLIEATQSRCLVHAGETFHHGKLVERPTGSTTESAEVMVA
jgi:hypothetical protein